MFREKPLPEGKEERKIKFIRGCKTHGLTEGFHHCGDKECSTCNEYSKVFLEELKKMVNNLDN